MITITGPIARWLWGRVGDDRTSLAEACVQLSSEVLRVLAPLDLSDDEIDAILTFEGEDRAAVSFSDEIQVRITSSGSYPDPTMGDLLVDIKTREVRMVSVYGTCSPLVDTDAGRVRQSGVVQFRVSIDLHQEPWISADLEVFSDVWLPYDLRGSDQSEICKRNLPRLQAALSGIADTLGCDTEPDDPTGFAIATTSGIENIFYADGRASDCWFYEVQSRNQIFRALPLESPGYLRHCSGPVVCAPVVSKTGLLGYIWASDECGAASFEPCWGEESAYKAGLVWLNRLRGSYSRGLSPLQALDELAALPMDSVGGTVIVVNKEELPDLDFLFDRTVPDTFYEDS